MEQSNYKQLSEDFIEFLFRFNRNFFRQTSLPLPVNHFVTLVALFENPALTISELSQQLNIAKQQVSVLSENESRDFTAALEKLNHMFGKIFPSR